MCTLGLAGLGRGVPLDATLGDQVHARDVARRASNHLEHAMVLGQQILLPTNIVSELPHDLSARCFPSTDARQMLPFDRCSPDNEVSTDRREASGGQPT